MCWRQKTLFPGVQIVGTVQEKRAEKKRWGQGERGNKSSSLPLPFFLSFSSLCKHLELVPEVMQRSTKKNVLFCYTTNTKSCRRDSRISWKSSGHQRKSQRVETLLNENTRCMSIWVWHISRENDAKYMIVTTVGTRAGRPVTLIWCFIES